jgi:hypothetical protein
MLFSKLMYLNHWLNTLDYNLAENPTESQNPITHEIETAYPKLKGFTVGHLDITS